MTSSGRSRVIHWIALVLLIAAAIGTQVAADGKFDEYPPSQEVQWVRSPGLMRRLVLGFFLAPISEKPLRGKLWLLGVALVGWAIQIAGSGRGGR